MKKKLGIFIMLLVLAALLCSSVFAANRVHELEVDVQLRADGSAYIVQRFHADTDEGTEFYLDYWDSGYLTITDFRVSDEDGAYEVLPFDTWDIDAGFDEKARKCGMLEIDKGVELCWGITEYGPRTYTVEYVLHDLVGDYPEADGFNYRFVNADMGFFPTDVDLTIRMQDGTPITDEMCDIWAFGYEGEIRFEDGVIHAWTDDPLRGDDNMTIMVGLENGILAPDRIGEGSFEDVKDRAFDGSDYEEDDTADIVVAILFCVAYFGVLLWLAVRSIIEKIRRRRLEKNAVFFTQLPNDGNLNRTYVLGWRLKYSPENGLLGARLLRLIVMGCLQPLPDGAGGRSAPLQLVREPESDDSIDREIYQMLKYAAGDNDILEPNELKRFCTKRCNQQMLYYILKKCKHRGTRSLRETGCITSHELTKLGDLTPDGMQQLGEMLGYKKFLKEFILMEDRQLVEAVVWREYLVYAVLFGIADETIRQLRKLYPQHIAEIEQYARYTTWSNYYGSHLYSAAHREHQRIEAARSSGSGGSSSSGGGGGFSGGGGGGTR